MELTQGLAISAAGIAAVADVSSRRIPNWLSLGTLVIGILLNTWLHGFEGAIAAVAGAALGIGVVLPFYAMGVLGAGDVKLLGGLGAVVGPQALVSVSVYAALAGGLMSVIILLRNRRLAMALSDIAVHHRPPARSGSTAPYGVAIAAGVLLSVMLPAVLG